MDDALIIFPIRSLDNPRLRIGMAQCSWATAALCLLPCPAVSHGFHQTARFSPVIMDKGLHNNQSHMYSTGGEYLLR
jgi:hypothetical protein